MNDQVFNEIKQKYNDKLSVDFKKMKLKNKGMPFIIFGILASIILFILWFVFDSILPLLGVFVCIIIVVLGVINLYRANGGGDYYKQYYNAVVKDVLEILYDDVNREARGEASFDYRYSGFDRGYYDFLTNSAWSMKYGNHDLKIYDIHTRERRADDENTTYVTTFKGLFGVMSLSHNFQNEVYVNKKGHNYKNLEEVNMDSATFSKEYKVYASDKVLAMQLLTHEVMEQLLEIANTNKIDYEFRIINDKLYYRIFNYNTFQNGSKEAINREELENDYNNVKLFIDILNIIEKSVYDNSINER